MDGQNGLDGQPGPPGKQGPAGPRGLIGPAGIDIKHERDITIRPKRMPRENDFIWAFHLLIPERLIVEL